MQLSLKEKTKSNNLGTPSLGRVNYHEYREASAFSCGEYINSSAIWLDVKLEK